MESSQIKTIPIILRKCKVTKQNYNDYECGTFEMYPDETLHLLHTRVLKLKLLTNLKSHQTFDVHFIFYNGNGTYLSEEHPYSNKGNKIGIPRKLEYEKEDTTSSFYEFIDCDTLSKDLYFYNEVEKLVIHTF